MDAYEATRVVFSRIQSLDPENAAKIMGMLLIQDHGEKEMIRLAFGPESLLQTVVVGARKELGLLPPSSPMAAANASSNSPAAAAAAANASTSSFLLGRQNSSSRLLGGGGGGLAPLTVSSPTSWAPPQVFSRSSSSIGNGGLDDLQGSPDELVSPINPGASPFYGAGVGGGNDLMDEFQLQEQLSFLNDGTSNTGHGLQIPQKGDLFYPDMSGECRSPGGIDGMGMFPYGMGGWGGHHRRSCSAADMYLSSDTAAGLGWKPCLYFARGYCKNGTSCRFLHGLPDDNAVATMSAGGKMDAATAVEQQCQEFFLRSKSQRQLMASAFPYSPTGSLPSSPSGANKCINFLIQQQNESQRAAAAAAAALMLSGGDDGHKFLGRSRMMERSDFALAMSNPGSRQIYLTFPADSTFKEEDVSNYFSIYGPVQDVRIPYQQKRMFGFVTFVYPETVKLILAKGNPHFVCDARVLVKPYKEKGKVPDKYRKQQQQQLERGDFSGCTTPTALDLRDPFELPPLGGRMLYNNSISQEALLKRKLEEQQEAAELQHAIELQSRRFMGLHLLDLKHRNHFSSNTSTANTCISSPTISMAPPLHVQESSNSQEDKKSNPATVAASAAAPAVTAEPQVKTSHESPVNAAAAADAAEAEESSAAEATPKEEISFQESTLEHNLPDSPFASPTKASSFVSDSFSSALATQENSAAAAPARLNGANHLIGSTSLFPSTPTLDISSFNPCFFPMARFSSDHGAVGM